MSRTPAKVTQADVARCVRAAIQAGAGAVEVRPDGTIFIRLTPPIDYDAPEKALEPHERAPL